MSKPIDKVLWDIETSRFFVGSPYENSLALHQKIKDLLITSRQLNISELVQARILSSLRAMRIRHYQDCSCVFTLHSLAQSKDLGGTDHFMSELKVVGGDYLRRNSVSGGVLRLQNAFVKATAPERHPDVFAKMWIPGRLAHSWGVALAKRDLRNFAGYDGPLTPEVVGLSPITLEPLG